VENKRGKEIGTVFKVVTIVVIMDFKDRRKNRRRLP
jgi:hypothetical protein